MKRKFPLIIIFCLFALSSSAQSDYVLSLSIKPNARSFVDIGEVMLPRYPRFELAAQKKEFTVSLSYESINTGFDITPTNPAVCNGSVPLLRSFDLATLGAGYNFKTKYFSIKPQTGLMYQKGTNTYGRCGNLFNDKHPCSIKGYKSFNTQGYFVSLDINYPFPKKDRKRIRRERYIIGLNGIYSHLPREVDHYAYGFHLGFHFLAKQKDGKWRF